jgi:predicted nucleotidyltransferase
MIVTPGHIATIIRRAKQYGVRRLILFGSALETPENAHDIDLAADIPGLDLYLFAGMVENELQCIIDIVPLDVRSPFIESVERYGKVIYDYDHDHDHDHDYHYDTKEIA